MKKLDLVGEYSRGVVGAIFVAASLASAGCGSSGSPSSSRGVSSAVRTPATTSRASYIAQVDAICRAASVNRNLAATTRAIEEVNTAKLSVEQAAARLAPLWEKEASQQRAYNAQIDAVQQPSGGRTTLAKLAAGREDVAATDERIAAMFRKNPEVRAYEAFGKELVAEETRNSALDRSYGFKSCGLGTVEQ